MLDGSRLQTLVEEKWSGRAKGYSEIVNAELGGPPKEAWLGLIESLIDLSGLKGAGRETGAALDIGTGPGFFAIILAQRGWRATGIDCAPEMLEAARSNAGRLGTEPNFALMDSHELGYPDGSFDLALCRNVTWTLRDPEAAYKEWSRVLRPGGNLLIFDANWMRHLFDGKALERHRLAEKEASERFGVQPFAEPDPEKARLMYSSLPMGRRDRPDWDVARLLELGFKSVKVESDIGRKVYDEIQRVQFAYAPMFAIRAVKA